jgi:hypothetical protein
VLIDSRTLPPDAVRTADVVVVGSGPSGLTVARRLLAAGLDVALIESGGIGADAEADGAMAAATDGLRFGTVAHLSGTRQVGGNANLWSVQIGDGRRGLRLVPLADSDLEPRPGLPGTGWPLTAADLAPAYRRAQREFGLPETGYDGALWERPGASRLPVDEVLRTDVFQFADRTTFSEQHVAEVAADPGCTLYHHAYALELRTDPGSRRVTEVRAASVPGREVLFRAPVVVVAAGGLAGTQLLLASPGVARGLDRASGGRAEEHLGGHFMDHPLLDGGVLVPEDPAVLDAMALYDLRRVDDVPVMGHLRLSDDTLRAEPVPQLSTMFFPRHRSQREDDPADRRAATGCRASATCGAPCPGRTRCSPAPGTPAAGAPPTSGTAAGPPSGDPPSTSTTCACCTRPSSCRTTATGCGSPARPTPSGCPGWRSTGSGARPTPPVPPGRTR